MEPRANLQFSFWLYPPNLNHVWIRKNHFLFRFIQNMSIFLNLFRRNSVPASQNLLSNQRQDDESSQSESEFKIRVKVCIFGHKFFKILLKVIIIIFILIILLRINLWRNRNLNMENMLLKIKKRKMVFNWFRKWFLLIGL